MSWDERLSAAGHRITAPRRAVIQVLEEDLAPLSPRMILERARRVHASLSLVTVYRTLALLAQFDLVRRVHHEDGCHGYVLSSPGHRHHVVCRSCGGSTEFAGESEIETLIRRVEKGTSYQVEDHLLQLVGLCPDCQQRLARLAQGVA
jgi:Fur family ferric uptake transcriptional regulator